MFPGQLLLQSIQFLPLYINCLMFFSDVFMVWSHLLSNSRLAAHFYVVLSICCSKYKLSFLEFDNYIAEFEEQLNGKHNCPCTK